MKSTERKNHTLLAASIVIVLMAVGCGREENHASAGATSTESKGVTRVAESQTGGPRGEAVGGIALTSAEPAQPADGVANDRAATETSNLEGSAASQAVSEPPDVVASIADSIAAPGSVVTVTATASSDVVTMTLADGLGKPKALTYDAGANLWKTTYRVPLKESSARLGFSITAANAHQQWRRVWVFPKSERARSESAPDTAQ
jgi:hypothetical protein